MTMMMLMMVMMMTMMMVPAATAGEVNQEFVVLSSLASLGQESSSPGRPPLDACPGIELLDRPNLGSRQPWNQSFCMPLL